MITEQGGHVNRHSGIVHPIDSELTEEQLIHSRNVSGVYFVLSRRLGMLKIGVSKNVRRRMETIQSHCPDHLDLLLVVPGDKDDERRIHEKFRSLNFRGEWFYWDARIKEFLDRCRDSGKFVSMDGIRGSGDVLPMNRKCCEIVVNKILLSALTSVDGKTLRDIVDGMYVTTKKWKESLL